MINKTILDEYFTEGINKGYKYIAISVKNENHKPEIIINEYINFIKKYRYIDSAYTYDLKLKANNKIQIISVALGNSLSDFEDIF